MNFSKNLSSIKKDNNKKARKKKKARKNSTRNRTRDLSYLRVRSLAFCIGVMHVAPVIYIPFLILRNLAYYFTVYGTATQNTEGQKPYIVCNIASMKAGREFAL